MRPTNPQSKPPHANAETSLDKALTVLEAIGRAGSCRLIDLSQAAGYPPATVHRILALLVRRGYVRQDASNKTYLLGLRCLDIFSRVQSNLLIVTHARPIMQALMGKTRETVNLVLFENEEAVYIDQVSNSKSLLRTFTRVGARVPLQSSGVGKAFLSTLPNDDIQSYFRRIKKVRYTKNSLTRASDFLRDIETARSRGYAVDREEYEEGVGCIASIINQGRSVAGAISISGPSSRLFGDRTDRLAKEVVESAKAISRKLADWECSRNI